jgi:hypothetical protein
VARRVSKARLGISVIGTSGTNQRNLVLFVQGSRLSYQGACMELAALIIVLVLAGSMIPGNPKIIYYR